MLNTFNLLIPDLFEIYNVIAFIMLIYTFSFFGNIISNEKSLSINFLIGWSSFLTIFHVYILFFNHKLFIFFYAYLSVFIILFLFLFLKKKNIFKIKVNNYRNYYFLIPLLLILISMKSFGWDSFAFHLPRLDEVILNNELPIERYRSNYPFTITILYYFTNIITGSFTENLPAIFEFILLILSCAIILEILKKKINIKFIYPLVFLAVFFNPIIMNVYSYSIYEDFTVSFVILVTIFFLYEKQFCLHEFTYKTCFTLGLILSLLSICKITGIVHVYLILFGIFIINLKKIDFLILKKLFFITIIANLNFGLWSYHIFHNEIFVAKEITGFRIEIFENLLNAFYQQLLQKKNLLISVILIPLLTIYSLLKKSLLTKNNLNLLIVTSTLIIGWLTFLIFWTVFMQTFSNAYVLHDLPRYMSQLSLIITLCWIILLTNFFKNYLEMLNKLLFKHFFAFVFVFLTFAAFYEIRRDLQPLILDANKIVSQIKKEETLNVFISGTNSSYLKEILRYRMKNKIKILRNKNETIDYIHIEYKNPSFKIFKK